jgi:hypothetical protein
VQTVYPIFFGYLVEISFPNRIDVWDRLLTHFETVKVMTFSSVTNISEV